MSWSPKKKSRPGKARRRINSLPPETLAAIVSLLTPRDHAAAVLASRCFSVLTLEERGRLHFARLSPKDLARAGSLDGIRYWHGVDPWRIDIHCLRAAAKGGYRTLTQWIIDESIGGGCPTEALCAAARGGQVDLMRWLIDERDATILKETLVNAISSNSVDAVCLLLDRAHEIDCTNATASDSGHDTNKERHQDEENSQRLSPKDKQDSRDDNSEKGNNDDNDDDDANDNDDGEEYGDDDDDDDEECDSKGRDWGDRPMREAARTNNTVMLQLIHERCYGSDPYIMARPLRVAAGCGATAAVEWILRHSAGHTVLPGFALKAALALGRRGCAVAILRHWPDVARPPYMYPWPVEQFDERVIPLLDAALAIGSRERPDTWPMPNIDSALPDDIYDAMLTHCLSFGFRGADELLAGALFTSSPCDAVFRWSVDIARYFPRLYDAKELARKGMFGRLAYCSERNLLTPKHVVEAMRGAAQRGRIDMLDCLWLLATNAQNDADPDTSGKTVGVLRANAQKIADAAAESGDWGIVEWLQRRLGKNAHCTAAAFCVAAAHGHAAFLERLYATGADRCRHPCDAPCENAPEWSPFLFVATTPCGLYDVNKLWREVAREGHYDVARVLRKHGVLDGVYLRNDAVLNGHAAIGAIDIAVNGPSKHDLMISYAVQARDLACLYLALRNGSTWSQFNSRYAHPIVVARKKGSRAIAKLLSKYPSSIEGHAAVYVDDEESDFDSESD